MKNMRSAASRVALTQEPYDQALSEQDRPSANSKSQQAMSVLAHRYVPVNLRNVNLMPVNWRQFALSLPSLGSLEGLHQPFRQPGQDSFVPEHSCAKVGKGCPCVRPMPVRTFYFGDPRQQFSYPGAGRSQQEFERDVCYALRPEAHDLTNPTPVTFDPATVKDAKPIFERLLQEERNELLRLYQAFSLYDQTLVLPNNHDPSRPVVSLSSPGLGETRPSIRVGDLSLARPCNMAFNGVPYDGTNCMEIVGQVKTIQSNGVVHITWPSQPSIAYDMVCKDGHLRGKKKKGANIRWNVRFVPSAVGNIRCATALEGISQLFEDESDKGMQEADSFFFPEKSVVVSGCALCTMPGNAELVRKACPKSVDSSLNKRQMAFVRRVVARTVVPSRNEMDGCNHAAQPLVRPPLILTGPAGTGKTSTLLAAIAAVLKVPCLQGGAIRRVLVVAPSHTAADVLARRLTDRKLVLPTQLFRLYDATRMVSAVPTELLPYTRQSKTGHFKLPSKREMLGFRIVVSTCSDAALLAEMGLTNERLRRSRACFAAWLEHECIDTGMSGSVKSARFPHFSHLFVDEASQDTEINTFVPLQVILDRESDIGPEVVLVGDPKQLSPNVYSSAAADLGLSQPLIGRLLERSAYLLDNRADDSTYDDGGEAYSGLAMGNTDSMATLLTVNYRSDPTLLMMPSTLFYYDKLEVPTPDSRHESAQQGWWSSKLRHVESLSTPIQRGADPFPDNPALCYKRQKRWPIHFRGVIGQDKSTSVESACSSIESWINTDEAEAVAEIVKSLCTCGQAISTESIGIMAPFRAQVRLIRKLLRKMGLGGVNVGTVEDYQAFEREIVVLSVVRSTPAFVKHDISRRAGLFQQPQRSNVALTRASKMMIVVGNPKLMSDDSVWSQWLRFVLRNGLWYGDQGGVSDENLGEDTPLVVQHPFQMRPWLSDSNQTEKKIHVSSLELGLR